MASVRVALAERLRDTAPALAELEEDRALHEQVDALLAGDARRAWQVERLARAARELTAERPLEELLEVVTETARELIGCHQAVSSRLVRGWTEARTYVSLSDKYARWRDYDRVPKGLGVLNAVTREGRPLRLSPEELRRHPDWRGLRDAPGHPPLPNYLAAPFIGTDGRTLGLIQLADRETRGGDVGDFTAEDEALLVALAQVASLAIEAAEARDREALAGARVDESARSLKLLADASRALTETLDLDAVLDVLADLVVPVLGDWCALQLTEEATPSPTGQVTRAADPALGAVLDALLAAGAPTGLPPEGVRDRLPREVRAALEAALPERALVPGTRLTVPLVAHRRHLATMVVVRVPGPPYTETERDLAVELGRRAASAIDNASRFRLERDTALLLQRSMLPDLRGLPGRLAVASRYLPGGRGVHVGGDWYDVVPAGEHHVALVVGDVMGRGIPAASTMGQLRAAVRAFALVDPAPEAVLARLDDFLRSALDAPFATCVYGLLDTRDGSLRIASAGHPPPVLRHADGSAELLGVVPGPPLGVGASGHPSAEARLDPGAVLVLYTDGLVERRHASLGDRLAALRDAVAGPGRRTPATVCDTVLERLDVGREEDDTALLAVALDLDEGPAPTRRGWSLPTSAASVVRARVVVREALGEQHARLPAVELIVSELVTNAVRHGEGETLELRLVRSRGGVRIEVLDGASRLPPPAALPPPEQTGGRGLLLVEALADRWGAEPVPGGGKRVWAELEAR